MICPACEEIFPPESYGEPKCCPACGAYYDKALKLRIARKAKAESNRIEPSIKQEEIAATAVGSKIDNALRAVISPTIAKPLNQKGPYGHPLYKGEMYCTNCGSVGGSKRHVPGSLLIEIVLWLCFFIPGLIYSVWRLASAKSACKICDQPTQIPANSPLAQKVLNG